MTLLRTLMVSATLLFGIAATAEAELLLDIEGVVLVDLGEGPVVVHGVVDVQAGDEVMIDAGASASILFSDGCKAKLGPGTTVVAAQSPCQSLSRAKTPQTTPRSGSTGSSTRKYATKILTG